jgi:hypothetical protein
MLSTHGDLIAQRWMKKSKDKRGRLLDSAALDCFGSWPPLKQREQAPWCPEFPEDPISMNLMLGTGLLGSWINIDEFVEDKTKLLSLLHVRTAFPPGDWASFDSREMKRYFVAPLVPLMFSAKCVRISGEKYGSMVEFDVELIHSGEVVGYPRAMAVLCIQQRMATGLQKIVDKLVAGAPPSGNVKWTNLVSDGLRSQADGSRWGVYDNQGFAPPSKFDPEALLDMAQDQLNRIVDEMEILQSDPEYLRDYALTLKANISWDVNVPSSSKWSYTAETIATLWTHRLSQWQIIVDKSRDLVSLCRKHKNAISTRTGLPSDIKLAIINYGLLIRDALEIELLHLQQATAEMDAMKDVYTKCARGGKLVEKRNYTEDFSKKGNRIEYVLFMVITLMGNRRIIGIGRGALRNFEAELASVKSDRSVNETASTIALLDAMRMIWRLGLIVDRDELASSDVYEKMGAERMCALLPKHGLCKMGRDVQRYDRLGSLLSDFCRLPWPKNRNSAIWLDKRMESRKLQGKFWRSAREDWQQHRSDPQSDIVGTVVGYMSFDVSPRYVAEVEAERGLFESELRRSQASNIPMSEDAYVPQSVWGVEPEKVNFVRNRPKRDDPAEEPELRIAAIDLKEELSADSAQTPAKPFIAVKQESKHIFDKMFTRNSTASSVR